MLEFEIEVTALHCLRTHFLEEAVGTLQDRLRNERSLSLILSVAAPTQLAAAQLQLAFLLSPPSRPPAVKLKERHYDSISF
jgi:hypothetical protein